MPIWLPWKRRELKFTFANKRKQKIWGDKSIKDNFKYRSMCLKHVCITSILSVSIATTWHHQWHHKMTVKEILKRYPDYKRTFPGKVLVVSYRRRHQVQSYAQEKNSKWRKRSFKRSISRASNVSIYLYYLSIYSIF